MSSEHVDVVVIGAGLSGIGAAYHLKTECPGKSFAILEARGAVGGTWDLFRYPGIRSDSDMYTLGYAFRPWPDATAIADGPSILRYIRDTARDAGLEPRIRYGHKVIHASWSSRSARWTLDVEQHGEAKQIACNFLLSCTGYYDYDRGHEPDFPDRAAFSGLFVHPQHWPDGLDTGGKRIVVIGSGATAMTLVPALARTGAKVTMLQRSPSYVVSLPSQDAWARRLRRYLPDRLTYRIVRWRNVLLSMFFYNLARKKPEAFKRRVIGMVAKRLGPSFDIPRHFTPRYNPWDQRLCLVPDSDLFKVLRSGMAEMVTDEIATFTADGISLKSGREIQADIIVGATGLKLKMLGGITVAIDGELTNFAETTSYKGSMFSNVPNFAYMLGYTNASWTLKCDLTSAYVCRVLNHMDQHGYASCVPAHDPTVARLPLIDFSSGYIQRAVHEMPRQGDRKPWRLNQNYVLDLVALKYGRIDDGVLRFARREPRAAA